MEFVSSSVFAGLRVGGSPSLQNNVARWLLLAVSTLALVHPRSASAGTQATGSDRVVLENTIKPLQQGTAASASAVNYGVVVRSDLTTAEAAEPMRIGVVLKMRNYAELQRRVAAKEIIAPAEMAVKYLPLESDHQRISQWLSSQGLKVKAAGAGRSTVFAQGTPQQFQQAFQAAFGRVSYQGKEYTSILEAPSVPAGFAPVVASLNGLQPYLRPRTFAAPKPEIAGRPPYLVNEILTAYDAATTGYTGAGQQIAIIIDKFPLDNDLLDFWSFNGINQSLDNISEIDVSGGLISTNPASDLEGTLDASWSSSVAPNAQLLIYGTGDLSNVGAAYSQIIDDLQFGFASNLHQLSMSYGQGENTLSPAELDSTSQLFTTISAYGVTIFAASGDHGALGGTQGQTTDTSVPGIASNADHTTVQVNYPASDPNVVAIGGTSLSLNINTGAVTSETAWSPNGTVDADNFVESSGGGVSSHFARPLYQVGTTVPGGTLRLVPDVALAADPAEGCVLVFKGTLIEAGGTSWSSATWVGLCALLNEARASASLQPVGVLNTSLYPLLGTPSFRDIVSGNNGTYNAAPGYDLVTGIGVPHFSTLLQALLTNVGAPTITSPTAASGQVPFVANGSNNFFTYQIAATNNPTMFGAVGLPPGLTLDYTTGLISGDPAAAGYYPVIITASNTGGTTAITLALTISDPNSNAPTITSFTPNTGPAGTQVTITGTRFGATAQNITSVNFNGVAAAFTGTATQLVTTVPNGASTGPIIVSSVNGTAATKTNFIVTATSQSPVITGPMLASTTINAPFSYQVTATNAPTSFTANYLPPGLTINPATGLISGTPTVAGTFQVTLSATNAFGTGVTALVLRVLPPPPVITSSLIANSSVGAAFSYQIAATNAPTSYNATGPIDNGRPTALPGGLRVNKSTGVISGSPTTAGTYQILISATNAGGTDTQTLALTVTAAIPNITSPLFSTGNYNVPYNYRITANNNTVLYGASGLPAGLNVNTSNGVISGTPTQIGTFPVTLTATNITGTGTATLQLTILPPPPVITSPQAARGQVSQPFTYQIVGTFAPTSYYAYNLPSGLSVDPFSGLISGTPVQAGTYQVQLLATNDGGTSNNVTLTLNILVQAPVITSVLTASGSQNVPLTYQITATNSPATFSASGLPPGLSVNTANGLISGAPTLAGYYQVTLSASNEGGPGTAILALLVNPPTPVITSGTAASVQKGTPFSYQVTATNTPTSYTASNLPAGLGINQSTGLIAGTPLAGGTFPITLSASNATGTGTLVLSLVVQSSRPTVTITATVLDITSVSGEASQLIITRDGDVSQPLTVSYTVKGSAASGVDYVMLQGTKTIKAGKAFTRLKIVALGSDLEGASKKSVKVVLNTPSDNSYRVGEPSSAKVKIFAEP